jgi:rSAM/selenodomain-associated transferase 1
MDISSAIPKSKSANALLIMAKRPTPGRTKTRLVPPLTLDQAAALYENLLRDTLNLALQVPDVQPVVAFTPAGARAYFASLAPDFDTVQQKGADLGARLDNALTHHLDLGYQRVVMINSDGPTIPLAYLVDAFQRLIGGADVVLGPADDGGYYLIGLKQPAPRLLREVRMSTPYVTTDTLGLAFEEGLRVALLPNWYDVDNATSLARLAVELRHAPPEIAPHTRAFLGKHQELLKDLTTTRQET